MTPADHARMTPLAEIRRRLGAVTPGQWGTAGPWQGEASVVSVDEGVAIWDVCWLRDRDVYHPQRDVMADAEFIACAPQDMAALLAFVDEVQTIAASGSPSCHYLERLRDALANLTSPPRDVHGVAAARPVPQSGAGGTLSLEAS